MKCSKNGEISFDYIGKSGKQQEQAVVDSDVFSVVRSLKLRRSRSDLEDLLVYRSGKRWHNVTAGDINDYLREISGRRLHRQGLPHLARDRARLGIRSKPPASVT